MYKSSKINQEGVFSFKDGIEEERRKRRKETKEKLKQLETEKAKLE